MLKKHLTIIGAGPKAMAIAAKANVLHKLGFSVPEIVILESQQLGAHWLPGTGFTNGRMKLGTPPEKDIGFPYDSLNWGKFNSLVNSLMEQYSWQNFLVDNKIYSTWIDRGRPAPEHQQWANYLKWVFSKLQTESPFLKLEKLCFHELQIYDNENWLVKVIDDNGNISSFKTNGVVVTGLGEIKKPDNFPDHPHIMDSKNFWSKMHDLKTNGTETKIAIIGSGETASAVAVAVGRMDMPFTIDLVAALATNYSRGESYSENHMYTDACHGHWQELTLQDRQDFIKRTDRGVFSIAMKQELDKMEHVNTIPGWFNGIEVLASNKIVLEIDYGDSHKTRLYDYVIFAMGYDAVKFLTLRSTKETRQEILNRTNMKEWSFDCFEKNIISDLSLKDLHPKLHLPALAALQQGPGFPNLSCLGRLADQILSAYVTAGQHAFNLRSDDEHRDATSEEEQVNGVNGCDVPSNNGK